MGSSKESQQGDPIPVEPFRLSTSTEGEPSMFEVRIVVEGVPYRYGFQVTRQMVAEEWLYVQKTLKSEAMLFSRDRQDIKLRTGFSEGKGLESKTRENALFLSVCSQLNGELSTKLVNQISRIMIITSAFDEHMWRLPAMFFQIIKDLEGKVSELLKAGDLGVTRLNCAVKTKPTAGKAVTKINVHTDVARFVADAIESHYEISLSHKKRDKDGKEIGQEMFDLFKEESEGTRKLFGLGGMVLLALDLGFTVVVDEFDARLHPIISKQLVNLFNSDVNRRGAQLIIATHDTNLLSHGNYRRDQIWFVEKDSLGATDLYSLVEYKTEEEKKIRKDASFEKDYIQGRYGAIPYLGDFEKLVHNGSANVAS